MSWHELSGLSGVSSHIKEYRKLERELGIRELPISINEYCDRINPFILDKIY